MYLRNFCVAGQLVICNSNVRGLEQADIVPLGEA
jgi:hypothetical protein